MKGMRMRLVLFSDLHLDTPFRWAQPDVARRRRQALRDTLTRVLSLAADVEADAVLCAGDLYEHDRVSPDTAAFLRTAFASAACRVVLAPGNHDWLGPDSLYARVDWPPNVHVFTEDRLQPLVLAEGVTLWGAAHRAPANTDGFLDTGFRVDRGGINLALFHGSERSGLSIEAAGKQPHAPFDDAQVPAAGLAHAFVGHYHTPRDSPHHTYPGNPEPLVFGEEGPRGAVVVDIGPDGSVRRERVEVAATRVHDVRLDVTGCGSAQEVRDAAVEVLRGREGVARLTLDGELPVSVDVSPRTDLSLRALGLEGCSGLEALVVRTGRLTAAYDLAAIAAETTVRGEFVREVLRADMDHAERQRVLTVGLRALDGRDDLEVA